MANLRADNLCGPDGRNAIDGSLFFDGADSYLVCTDNSDFALGTGDFTVEAWFLVDTNLDYRSLIDNRTSVSDDWMIGMRSNDRIYVYSGGFLLESSTGAVTPGHWHHVAYVRSSGTHTLYLNGVSVATSSTSKNYDSQKLAISAPPYSLGTEEFKGYVSNVRIIKGTALYTTDFTPPTSKLTAVDGTVLLCCQDSDDPTQEATGKTIAGYGNLNVVTDDVQLVTNGHFDSDISGWTVEQGAASWNSGQADLTSPATTLSQNITTVVGRTYRMEGTANDTGNTSNNIGITLGSRQVYVPSSNFRPAAKTFTAYWTATSTTTAVKFWGGTDGTGKWSNVSVKLAEQPKQSNNSLPPVGVDEGVVFDGDTKINSQGYMYFSTGDTSQRSRGLALFGGGITPSITSMMDYCHIPTMGNLIRWGDLTASKNETSAFSSSTRGVWAGGTTGTYQNVIESVEFATQATPTDFGDLTVARGHSGGTSNSTRGLVFGGYDATPNPDTMYNTIDYVTIATSGDAINFGDTSETGWSAGGARSSTTRAVTGGYATPSNTNTIDYVTIATTGDASNFGDLNHAGYGTGAGNVSNGTRAVFLGNSDGPSNTIDYITIATTGNATDFGDLTAARRGGGSASTLLRGILVGGRTPSEVNTIDYVTIATTGNGSDFGDATSQVSFNHAGCSDSHGGLS